MSAQVSFYDFNSIHYLFIPIIFFQIIPVVIEFITLLPRENIMHTMLEFDSVLSANIRYS